MAPIPGAGQTPATLLARASTIFNTYLASLGLLALRDAQWVSADHDTTLEIHTLWQPDPTGASALHISVVHNVARLITVNELLRRLRPSARR